MGLVATEVGAQAPSPQFAGVSRTLLSKTELPGGTYVTLLASIEIAPGTTIPWHTHPGVESAYVLEGEADILVRGQPDRSVKASEGFQVPAETPHSARTGDKPFRLAVTYVIEKDKPLVALAPQ